MKIYFNRKPVTGPWGGGNKTLHALVEAVSHKHEITYSLDEDVDLIYCQDPKPGPDGLWYQDFLDHKLKHGTKIIQRVGDIGTHRGPQITQLVKDTLQYSDIIIFPSDWARRAIGFNQENYFIVHNAPNDAFYKHRDLSISPKQNGKIRIVTHHWSDNDMKGFDVYEKLGNYANSRSDIEFSYIGRYSNKFSHNGISLHKPIDIEQLSVILPTYDVYLTASKLEAGANHVLEGIACGLPVLYRSGGGSIDEYCCQYGLQYETFDQLVKSIEFIKKAYSSYKGQVARYNHKISEVISAYTGIIGQLEHGT